MYSFIYAFIQKYLIDLCDVTGVMLETKAKYLSKTEFLPLMNLKSGRKDREVLMQLVKCYLKCAQCVMIVQRSAQSKCKVGWGREEVRANLLEGILEMSI